MNILFLSLGNYKSLQGHGIYPDILRQFADQGDMVYVISPLEKRTGEREEVITEGNATFVRVQIGNITKTNIIEKGISTLKIEGQVLRAIREKLPDVKFDLVLYPTPPITFYKCVKYIKNRDGARTYLMLKDIFPQNAVDIGLLSKSGFKGFIYRYFRGKEKKLYAISDRIGCMSKANVDYVLKNNPEVDPKKVDICPNAIEYRDLRLDSEARIAMRKKYGIPLDKKVFVYGGNLGKPQGIPFVIQCIEKTKDLQNAFFLIVGDGTEYQKLDEFVKENNPRNMKLMKSLPKEDYDRMVASCDVGLIFLDYRFTIPNFPSRLLSYMQAGLPVLAATDVNTDIGKVITDGGFGWWCGSNDVSAFCQKVEDACKADPESMQESELRYLKEKYDVSVAVAEILKK